METAADGGCEDYWCNDGDGGGGRTAGWRLRMQDNWDESCVVADGNYSSSRPVDFYCGKISQAIIALFPRLQEGYSPNPVGYPPRKTSNDMETVVAPM